jgi:SAM-dependent methyltransferase
MNINDYIKLWKLSRRRLRSEEDYREFQAFQAALIFSYLQDWGVHFEKRPVLDLGSGVGGYSREMTKREARVISLDLTQPLSKTSGLSLVADALSIPLRDESVSFVLCASLIEHVIDPARLLEEIRRVLKKKGHCYLSFPPFYSPWGGHEFSPFHYLGEDWAIRLKGQRREVPEWVSNLYEISTAPQSFAKLYQDWGLFKMTVAKARHLIDVSGLEMLNISTRYLPVSFIRWPVLGEVLTWHAQFLLKKSS